MFFLGSSPLDCAGSGDALPQLFRHSTAAHRENQNIEKQV